MSVGTSRLHRKALLIAAGLVAAMPAVASPAMAAARQSPTGSPSTATVSAPLPSDVKPLCAWPPPRGSEACMALARTDVKSQVSPLDVVDPAYGPSDLRSAYKLPSGGGSGSTVALVDAFDDPAAEIDLGIYRDHYGLPACTTANGCFKKVNEAGKASPLPVADDGWSGEISLDIDMVSAICPGCHILLVEASNASTDDLGQAAVTAVALGAKFVSNSYGSPEWSEETNYDYYYHHTGVVMTVSGGDFGYGTFWPASSQYVTAVGGTSLLRASNARGWDEIAWTDTGSGCSGYEPKPSWQHDSGCSNRTMNDVAAVADPNTGVMVYSSAYDGWNIFGGTSAGAPIIAAIYALAANPASGSQSLYRDSGQLFDVVAGGAPVCSPAYLCTAQPGFDGPTGLGTPDGTGAF